MSFELRVKRLSPSAVLPAYQSAGAAGIDLHADCDGPYILGQSVTGRRVHRIPTGLAFEIPDGFVGLVTGRSGLSSKGLIVELGKLDSDYRGPVSVMVWVQSGAHTIHPGDRIAQLVVIPCPRLSIVEADELSETARNAAGFGSTGSR
ncbi:MAG TPA: dUTP diphosphatase [Polyangiales bacterium]|nr:dUTP diphosphatase [Polyangiales bacterium]